LGRHSSSFFIHFNLIISYLSQNSVTFSLQDFPFIRILCHQTAQDTAGRGLVGAGGVLRLCPRGLHYVLTVCLVGAAGCTLRVRAAGSDLVGAGGVLGLCPHGSGFALTARALPSRLGLCPHGSGFALTARTLPSRLGLCPHGSGFALTAWALPWRFALRAHSSGFALTTII
jgi:hypothetical protein